MAIYTKAQLIDRNVNTYFPNEAGLITALTARGFNRDFIDSIWHYIDNAEADFGQLSIWDNTKFGYQTLDNFIDYDDEGEININSQAHTRFGFTGAGSRVKVPTFYTVTDSNDLTDKKFVDAVVGAVNTALTNHVNTSTIHRVLNDASTTTTSLWSSSKISTELGLKVNTTTFNAHTAIGEIHRVLDDNTTTLTNLWSASKIAGKFSEIDVVGINSHIGNVDIHRTMNDDVTNAITLWSGNKIQGLTTAVQTNLTNHINNLNIHRVLDDTAITETNLWSGSKINSELGDKATTTQLNAHTGTLNIHRVLNDAVTNNVTLWSSSKINTEITDATAGFVDGTTFNSHIGNVDIHRVMNDDVTNAVTIWSGNKISGLTTAVQTNLNTHTGIANIHRVQDDTTISVTNLWSATKINSELSDKVTTTQFNGHVNTANIHRVLNDALTNTTTLWSGSKINTEISNAITGFVDSASFNSHINNVDIHRVLNDDVTDAITLWSGTKINGLVSGVQSNLTTHINNLNIHRTLNDDVINETTLWSGSKINSELGDKATTTQLNTHTGTLNIHRVLNDATTTTTNLWSASKINGMIAAIDSSGIQSHINNVDIHRVMNDDVDDSLPEASTTLLSAVGVNNRIGNVVGNYLPLAGGTLTGNLDLLNTTAANYIRVSGGGAGSNISVFELAAADDSMRWQFRLRPDKSFLFSHNDGTSWSNPFIITSAGTVGVANATPDASYKLDVGGRFNAFRYYLSGVRKDTVWDGAATDLSNHTGTANIHRVQDDTVTTTSNLWSAAKTNNEISNAVTDLVDLTTYSQHVNNLNIHRPLNDDAATETNLWSGSKISSELADKPTNLQFNNHINNTAIHAAINDAGVQDFVLWSAAKIITELDNVTDNFDKGGFTTGTGINLSGTLTNRLVGLGNVTIALDTAYADGRYHTKTIADARFVRTDATSQTIAGTKNFTGVVVVGTPATDTSAANKKYVDDNIPNISNMVTTNTNQALSGTKTFTAANTAFSNGITLGTIVNTRPLNIRQDTGVDDVARILSWKTSGDAYLRFRFTSSDGGLDTFSTMMGASRRSSTDYRTVLGSATGSDNSSIKASLAGNGTFHVAGDVVAYSTNV